MKNVAVKTVENTKRYLVNLSMCVGKGSTPVSMSYRREKKHLQ